MYGEKPLSGSSLTAGLRWSGCRRSGHGACAEQNDKGRYARKRAYYLTIATSGGNAYPGPDLFNKAHLSLFLI